MKFIYLLQVLVVLLFATACNTNETVDNPSDVKENSITKVKIEVAASTLNTSEGKFSINTLLETIPVSETECEIQSVYNDLPQLYFVTDENENIILLSRKCISKEDKVVINEETTALALATLNPLFVGTAGNDFNRIEALIKSTDAYNSYLDIVRQTIGRQESIFEDSNTELLVALNDVLEEVCSNINIEEHNSRSIFTRASNIVGINPDPVSVQTSGIDVIVRNKGLIPTYECQVYHGARLIDTQLIESHKAYGFLDLFSTEENRVYGEPQTFTLTNEGEYRFYLDRTTDKAISDFSHRLWGDVLSMVGLYGTGAVLENSAAAIGAIGALLVNPDTDFTDVLKAVSGLAINIGIGLKWKAAGAILTKINVVYNVLKGFSNEMSRAVLGFTAPYFIDFCLCSYNYSITSCTETEIEKISGDDQEGFAEQRLLLPLTVSTKVFADDGTELERSTYQKVKFEVVSGGGSVSREIVGTEAGSNLASTYWTIGKEGEQKVKAVIVDMVTGVEVSEPVFFTARIRENADLTVRLDWNKLSGNTDIDLHVTDPYGEEIAYYNMRSRSGGWLDRDDVIGPGPEHICWTEAPSGAYLVQVHYFGSETQAVTNYTVTINANGQNYGPFTGSIGYHQLVTIGVLNLPDGTFTRSSASRANFERKYEVKDDISYPYKK